MANVLKSATADTQIAESSLKSAARSVSGLAGFNLNDFATEGQKHLQECQRQVRQMLDQANKDAAKIRSDAQKQGHQEGIEKAQAEMDQRVKKEGDQRAKDGLRLIENAVAQMHDQYAHWMQRYTELLHGIALAAAEKVTRQKLDQDSDLLLTWVSEAVTSTR